MRPFAFFFRLIVHLQREERRYKKQQYKAVCILRMRRI